MNVLLRRFVQLIEADLAPAGFVRRGPVFRFFDAEGNGIALDIQRTSVPTMKYQAFVNGNGFIAVDSQPITVSAGAVAFFVNVGVLLAPHLRYHFGDDDPRRDAMPHHSVWHHRLVATDETARLPDHTFLLSTDTDAERAAAIVQTWLAENLPRMKRWLGNYDAMLATVEEDRERSAQASAEQLASGRWKAGRWPDGTWNEGIIRAYAHAQRGDVDAVTVETANWSDTGADSLAAHALSIASQRRTERQG